MVLCYDQAWLYAHKAHKIKNSVSFDAKDANRGLLKAKLNKRVLLFSKKKHTHTHAHAKRANVCFGCLQHVNVQLACKRIANSIEIKERDVNARTPFIKHGPHEACLQSIINKKDLVLQFAARQREKKTQAHV